MSPITLRLALLSSLAFSSVAVSAHAFDPNEGAETAATQPARYKPLPNSVVPQRYYTSTPRAILSRPVPVAAVSSQPHTSAAAQAVEPNPSYNAPIAIAPMPETTATGMPAENYVQAAPVQHHIPTPNNYDANRFSLGIEGFYDHYEEPVTFPDLNQNAYYGSVDLGYEHYFNPHYYTAVEQRVSRGSNRYKSSQGHIADVPQWEFETRLLGGYDATYASNHHIKAYIGLGSRYYVDELKGKQTSLGANGYERRIFQLYLPVGVTYSFPAYGMMFAPNIEVDPLLYGNVQSRLQNIVGNEEFNNRQSRGIGVRAEFMMGNEPKNGIDWQFGPFVRYWNVPDSKLDSNATGTGMEPKNTRIQAGAKLKMSF